MMEVRCGKCGQVFQVGPSDESQTVKCPNCGAGVFVPAALGEAEFHPTPPPPEPTPPRTLLKPLEVIVVVGLALGVVGAVLYKALVPAGGPKTPTVKPPTRPVVDIQKRQAEECLQRMSHVAKALAEYKKKHNSLPDSLEALLSDGLKKEDLECARGAYKYLPKEAEAARERGMAPSEVLLLVDGVEGAHRGKRNAVTLSLEVKSLDESVVKARLDAQQAHLAALEEERRAAEKKRLQRERKAEEAYAEAIRLKSEEKPEAAQQALKRLREEYADTDFTRGKQDELKRLDAELTGLVILGRAQKRVTAGDLDGAEKIYKELAAREGFARRAQSELEFLEHYRKALRFRTKLGELDNALQSLSLLEKKTTDPFWRRLAQHQRQSIEAYEQAAVRIAKDAEGAAKDGKYQRALALYEQLVWRYPHAKATHRCESKRREALERAPLGMRLAPKSRLMPPVRVEDVLTAIKESTAYLISKQSRDGSWQPEVKGPTAAEPEAVTAAVMLALIGEGNTHIFGKHRESMEAALQWLLSRQRADGYVGSDTLPSKRYSHALVLLALAELYGTTRDASLKEPLRKAVDYAIKIKTVGGGWKAQAADAREDVMLTAWMLTGLAAVRGYEPALLPHRIDTALKLFSDRANSTGLIDYKAKPSPTPARGTAAYQESLAKTAAAGFARLLVEKSVRERAVERTLTLLGTNLPRTDDRNHLYWFFGTHLYRQKGPTHFAVWWAPTVKTLLQLRIDSGERKGAWDASVHWAGFRGGHLFDTALAILTLQAPYMHPAGLDLGNEPPSRYKKVKITFKDQTTVTGWLVGESDEKVTIRRTYGTVDFDRSSIEKIEEVK